LFKVSVTLSLKLTVLITLQD